MRPHATRKISPRHRKHFPTINLEITRDTGISALINSPTLWRIVVSSVSRVAFLLAARRLTPSVNFQENGQTPTTLIVSSSSPVHYALGCVGKPGECVSASSAAKAGGIIVILWRTIRPFSNALVSANTKKDTLLQHRAGFRGQAEVKISDKRMCQERDTESGIRGFSKFVEARGF